MDNICFTAKQKDTFNRIEALQQKIENRLRPDVYVLNQEIMSCQDEIDQIQKECDHIFSNGVCMVCGKGEND